MAMRLNLDLNIEMNFMPAADSRVFMFGHVDVYEIEYRFEYRNEFHASSRFAFFLCMGMWMSMRLNKDLKIEMNIMPAADTRCFMYGNMHSV